MKALITGVAGFVGSNLAAQLVADGHQVIGIDSLSDYYDVRIKKKNLGRLEGDLFQFVEGDINSTDLEVLLEGVSHVFHEAGQPGVRKSWGSDFQIYTEANVMATQRLLEACAGRKGIERFVYASSSSVYGDAENYPTEETALPRPISPYGVSKLAAEHLCGLYATNFDVPTVSLRYFTVYGPGQRPDMAFTRFMKAAVLDEEIRIFGTGEQIRDFTYIEDVVEANILAATTPGIGSGDVFNIAGGSNVSVNEVLKEVELIHGRPLTITYQDSVAGDVFRTGGATDSFREATGWVPKVDVYEGLKRHYEWAVSYFGSKE